MIDEPRFILSHLTGDFREMAPDARYNWCCGGGGGLVVLGEDNLAFRMNSTKVWADQVHRTGAAILATACENCHSRLRDLNNHYKIGVQVRFLSSMMADALVA